MNPDLLREKLTAAVAREDRGEIKELCHRYESVILENFESWAKVPASVRYDHDAVVAWLTPLVCIAKYFQDAFGHPELLERLSAGSDVTSRPPMAMPR